MPVYYPARRQPRWLPLFLLIVLAVPARADSTAPPVISGLRAALHDETRPYLRAGVQHWEWHTYWVLKWNALPGVQYYELVYKTSEGVSAKTARQTEASFKLEVAKGDNPQAAGMPTRDVQLATIQSLLAVSVAARLKDGTLSKRSPWFEVGRTHP